jgi:FKBP-type peptidyl-prolyl cis-trans isomerase FklB
MRNNRAFTSFAFALAIASAMARGSTQAAEDAAAQEAPAPVKSTKSGALPAASPLKNHMEELSYAIGANLGNSLRQESVTVDPDLLFRGLKDSLAGKPVLLSPHEINAIVNAFQEELKAKQIKQAARKIELSESNKKEAEAFLSENSKKEGVVTLPGGLQYKILKAGNGKKPIASDTIICAYRGTTLDGKEFDSSYKRKEPATFPLVRIIPGWRQALQLMPLGSKWQLYVPPELAYGERGMPPIVGPNAALIFEVELLGIKDRPGAASPANAGQNAKRTQADTHR